MWDIIVEAGVEVQTTIVVRKTVTGIDPMAREDRGGPVHTIVTKMTVVLALIMNVSRVMVLHRNETMREITEESFEEIAPGKEIIEKIFVGIAQEMEIIEEISVEIVQERENNEEIFVDIAQGKEINEEIFVEIGRNHLPREVVDRGPHRVIMTVMDIEVVPFQS